MGNDGAKQEKQYDGATPVPTNIGQLVASKITPKSPRKGEKSPTKEKSSQKLFTPEVCADNEAIKLALSRSRTITVDSSITTINLQGCKLDEIKIKLLCNALIKLHSQSQCCLLQLYLQDNSFGDAGMANIAELFETNITILELDLSQNNLSAEGVRTISEVLCKNKTLTHLILNGNAVGDEGCTYVSKTIAMNVSILSIGLSKNQIGDEGTRFIANGIAQNGTLETLHLHHNIISDKGVQHLIEVLSRSLDCSLHTLCLTENKVSEQTLKQLEDQLVTRNSNTNTKQI